MLNRKRFRHRRNLYLPFYLLFYRLFHQVFEEQICRNMGPKMGSYMRVLAVVRSP